MAQQHPLGPNGQRLHIAHRRSPSELTPLMMEQLALAQQLNALQSMQNGLLAMPGNSSMSQQGLGPGTVHTRNLSALSGYATSGPPPAPSSGYSGTFTQNRHENVNPRNRGGAGGSGNANSGHARRHSLALNEAKRAAEVAEQKRKNSSFQFPPPSDASSSAQSPSVDSASMNLGTPLSRPSDSSSSSLQPPTRGGRHGRSQSSIVTTRGGAGGVHNRGQSTVHARSGSHAIDGNWRFPNSTSGPALNVPSTAGVVQPPALINTLTPPVVNPAMFSLSPGALQLAQLQALQQFNGQYLGLPQFAQFPLQPQMAAQQAQQGQHQHLQSHQQNQQQQQQQQHQQQQQQRKTLFTPYLPQASLPQLLEQGHLVSGILRVNKKNRSDAYVTCPDLDADIFICGSKDRNRALESDLVAVELLDVDEVWNQKREKEEKKKRKDNGDNRSIAVNDATTQPESSSANDGSIRRRGSLKQRPTQKKNDDVEVEGQSLLLMEEDEINDEQKPLYAGHIVAVIERIAGQMFSGTLGLLRPSSQATKEKQDAERAAREGSHIRYQPERQERPKIVWFKPTDKRVPLIAIPTEQAPRDFVDRHADYANRIFVACIKRWPITSLHPFGSLVEQLGEMGDLNVETDALLRDNNFASDNFSDAVLNSVGYADWSVATEDQDVIASRRDFRDEFTFTIDPNGTQELDHAVHVKPVDDDSNLLEVGVHVSDVAHFIKANSLVDREAKKRGTAVYLMNRTVNMLPPHLAWNVCCLSPDQDRFTVTVSFVVNNKTGEVLEDRTWVGKSIIKSRSKLSYSQVDAVLCNQDGHSLDAQMVANIKLLESVTALLRRRRFGTSASSIPSLRLLHLLDDENVPVERNIFDYSRAHELIEEIHHTVNSYVAKRIYEGLGPKAFLRRQAPPNPRRLQYLADRMKRLGVEFDTTSSASLQNSIFAIRDDNIRRGVETLLVKTMQRAKYFVAGKQPEENYGHYALNLPLYTHFTGPSRRYADVIVHRQLEAVLLGQTAEFPEEIDSLSKTADMCNTKKDSASNAQEQSVHIEACRAMDQKRHEVGGDLISEGIVLCVYESAFDVLIPEWGFEKRVHCDQLPLKKAEFDKGERILELYWEKGVPSSTYIPEDERPKPAGAPSRRNDHFASAPTITTTTVAANDDDLFDYDEGSDDNSVSDLGVGLEGVSLSEPSNPLAQKSLSRTKSDSKLTGSSDIPESKLTNKERLLKLLTVRQQNGDHIQTVRELTSVPVILKTDMAKSPPCLTIRSVNPFAL